MTRLIACLIVTCGLFGCGASDPALQPLADDAVILAFGDSLTRGTGAKPGEDYPSVLSGLIGRKVINEGVPGEISETGLARLPAVLDRTAPALLILCHGGNDMLQRKSETGAAGNLRAMIGLARERGIEVLLVGVPEPGLFLSTAELYDTVASETATPIERDAIPEILGSGDLKADPVHPNAEGYRVLAERLEARLGELGAL